MFPTLESFLHKVRELACTAIGFKLSLCMFLSLLNESVEIKALLLLLSIMLLVVAMLLFCNSR